MMQRQACDWQVELIDTGMETQTGGRIKRLAAVSWQRHVHADLG